MPLFTIHVEHLHVHAVDDETRQQLSTILQQQETIMAQFSDIKGLLPALNDATNALAARVQTLIDRLTNAPSEADLAEVADGLTTLKSQLEAIAADPENPLPPIA